MRSSSPDSARVTVSLPRRRLSSLTFLTGAGLAGTLAPFLVIASSSSSLTGRRLRAAAAAAAVTGVAAATGVSDLCSRRASSSSARSEEHTSELQSPDHLVCRLLLEKKKCVRVCQSLVLAGALSAGGT